jgi:DNA-binding MarR family transcriptional regulator
MATNPKRGYKPLHLKILLMYHQGYTLDEISHELGVTVQTCSNIINSPDAQALLDRVRDQAFETILDVRTDFQAMAPACASRLFHNATQSADDRVSTIACVAILDRAGHSPTQKLEVSKADPADQRFKDMSEEEIRKSVFREAGLPEPPDPSGPRTRTVH